MTQQLRARSRATTASCEAYIIYVQEADRDGVRTPEEAEIICLLDTCCQINELKDVADEIATQISRIPETAPNDHVCRRLQEVIGQWETARHTLGSDGAAAPRGLVAWEDKGAA